MGKRAIDEIFEQGIEIGVEKGRLEGRLEGELRSLRESIFRFGRKRFKQENPSIAAKIQDETNVAKLQEYLDRVISANTWEEIVDA